MGNPLDKATATAPPTVGEGCLSRYDPEALSSEDGTEFPGAAALWRQLSTPGPASQQEQPQPAIDQPEQ